MNKKYLTLFFCAFIASLSLFAQNQSDSLIMRDILLEKDYSPQIENAGKVYQTPGTEALNTNKQPDSISSLSISTTIVVLLPFLSLLLMFMCISSHIACRFSVTHIHILYPNYSSK